METYLVLFFTDGSGEFVQDWVHADSEEQARDKIDFIRQKHGENTSFFLYKATEIPL